MDKGCNVAGVQFRRAGKIYDFICGDVALQVGDQVVVDTERGPSMARVAILRYQMGNHELKPILRKPSKFEIEKPPKVSQAEVITYTREQIKKHGLDMKILTSDIQFGGNKITIYFSSAGRVDFRDLVKALATGLKARVELKQVGSRDETKLVGGLGICGREYCCSSFLREFVPVSIRMAKNQNLALNPNKVSGGCGRLLCCLTYEDQVYTDLRKNIPSRGTKVRLLNYGGVGDVLKGDILNQVVLVETSEGQQILVPIAEIEIVSASENRPSHQDDWGGDLDLDALSTFMDDNSRKAEGKFPDKSSENRSFEGKNPEHSRQNRDRSSNSSESGRSIGSQNDGRSEGHRQRNSNPSQSSPSDSSNRGSSQANRLPAQVNKPAPRDQNYRNRPATQDSADLKRNNQPRGSDNREREIRGKESQNSKPGDQSQTPSGKKPGDGGNRR